MHRKTKLISLFLMIVIIIVLFVTGSSLLIKNFLGIPSGNLILWLGFIALQLFFYELNDRFKNSKSTLGSIIRTLSMVCIICAVLWLGIAYLLSGNIQFNFSAAATSFWGSPQASIVHWYIIYTLILAPFVLTMVYRVLRFFERRKK